MTRKKTTALFLYAVSQVKPELLRHLPTATWMTDMTIASRRSGRTTICALALLRQAVENPGVMVRFIDHVESGGSHTREIIRYWMDKSGFDRALHSSDNRGFSINISERAMPKTTDDSAVEPDETLLRAFSSLLDAGYSRDELIAVLDRATAALVHNQ